MRRCSALLTMIVFAVIANAQTVEQSKAITTSDHAARIQQIIDKAVNPLPNGFKGMIVAYLDDYGPVYRSYGIATTDGTVPLNEKTLFGVGSMTKLFSATLAGIANVQGLSLNTPARTLLPPAVVMAPTQNRYGIRLVDLADHHGGLPKNEGHLYGSLNDLYNDYAADPMTCDPSTPELIHDCGCCDPTYMSLLGLQPTCGTGVANPVYSCKTHAPTTGQSGWLYSNLGFEVLGATVATWMGYHNWNTANLQEITQPLNMPDTASTPAKPNERVVLYGVGFGLPSGTTVMNGSSSQSGSLATLPNCRVGSGSLAANAIVSFAGLISPGLYQINLTVPSAAVAGDNPVFCTYNDASTPSGAVIAVQP